MKVQLDFKKLSISKQGFKTIKKGYGIMKNNVCVDKKQ